MTTIDIAKRLLDLCKANENLKAVEELYADDAVSVEPMGDPTGQFPRETAGKAAILKAGEWWVANHEIHSAEYKGPYPHEDRFILFMQVDVTAKGGPMEGQRFTMAEACHYTVRDGKISRAEFYWDPTGCAE